MEESSMRGQNSSGGRRALCVDRTAAKGGELYAWTEQQRMVSRCVERTEAEEGELNAWTEQQRREESSMRGHNSSVGRRAQCVDRTAVYGGELNAWTEQQRREESSMRGQNSSEW
jgi:hypothetical protein